MKNKAHVRFIHEYFMVSSPTFTLGSQRSRLDKCGSYVHIFGSQRGPCAHAFPLPDTPFHTKVTFIKTMAIESQNTWFVVEQLEQILRSHVPCNVCRSDDLCCVMHYVLLCALKGRDKKSIDGMAENQLLFSMLLLPVLMRQVIVRQSAAKVMK